MKSRLINGVLVGLALAAGIGPALAELKIEGTEIVTTLENWNADDGYIVVGGRRYPLDGAVEVVNQNGEPLALDALQRGASVGILEENGRVTKLVVFDN